MWSFGWNLKDAGLDGGTLTRLCSQSQIKWTLNTKFVPKHQKPHDKASAWPQGKGEFHVFTCLHATRLREADRSTLVTAHQPRHACLTNQTALSHESIRKKNYSIVIGVVLAVKRRAINTVALHNGCRYGQSFHVFVSQRPHFWIHCVTFICGKCVVFFQHFLFWALFLVSY